ncbi:MAG: hypothetical protein AAGF90_18265 [Pseudomonadota bacterium]
MTTATLSAVDANAVDAARAAHPDAFPAAGRGLRRWSPWLLALGYLLWSMWYFDFGLLFQSSDRVWALLRAIFVWEDMATWRYDNIYSAIAETLAMAFLGTLMGSLGAPDLQFILDAIAPLEYTADR